jgi:hypothetical protein
LSSSITYVKDIKPYTGVDTEVTLGAITVLGCDQSEMVAFEGKVSDSEEEILCFARHKTFTKIMSFEVLTHFPRTKATKRMTMQFSGPCRTKDHLI